MKHTRLPLTLLSTMAMISVASPAHAQDEATPSAAIRLLSQTAWTTPEEPMLRVVLRVRNESDTTILDPAIVWTLGTKVDSRVEYETALREGPAIAASADTIPFTTDLGPGAVEDVRIRIDASETGGIDPTDSAVYPLRLELRSEDQPIADLTTAEIHIVREPEQPVLFSWWTEIATPVAFGPDGTLVDRGFEESLASKAGVAAQVEAVAEFLADTGSPSAVDLIVSPAALDQLRQAANGYRRSSGGTVPEDAAAPLVAGDTLRLLQEMATDAEVHVHAMPFAAPRLPALLVPRLRPHLDTQWLLGDQTVERLMGERPDPSVARPPGLAFDQATVDELAERGVTTILGAADSVDRPEQPNNFAPPPAAVVPTTTGRDIALVLPDPGAQALLTDPEILQDPVRGAQAVLGELATIWRERPVDTEITRGLALDLPPDLPAEMWGPLVRRIGSAPFLHGVHAEDLPDQVRPAPLVATLGPRVQQTFSPGYVSDLFTTARDVTAFAAMLAQPDDEADRLQRAMLYAEASQYIGNEGSGRAWIDAVNEVTDRTFAHIRPDTSRVLTFTSRSGSILLQMGDPGEHVFHVVVELASGRVEFLEGSSKLVRLDHPGQIVTFPAEVKAAGRSSIEVIVRAPNGLVLSHGVLVVRSTAVNPIALIITVGAGLVLVGLWSRRLFRRRTT